MIPEEEMRGAVLSSISVASGGEGSVGDFVDDDEHHMEEVVEHLDVIGLCCSLLSVH